MKAINNVVHASKNIINAATSTVSVSAQMVADGTELLNDSVTQTPLVLKALLTAPFAAAKGYIMESEGVGEAQAEARAYRFIKQSLSVTIEEVGVGSGKLLADLLRDEEDNAASALVGPTQQ